MEADLVSVLFQRTLAISQGFKPLAGDGTGARPQAGKVYRRSIAALIKPRLSGADR